MSYANRERKGIGVDPWMRQRYLAAVAQSYLSAEAP